MANYGFWKEAFKFSRFGCCQLCWKVENKADWFDACPDCRKKWDLWMPAFPKKHEGAVMRWAKAKKQEPEEDEDYIEQAIEEFGLADDWGVYGTE